MEHIKLIIKYNNKFFLAKNKNEYTFIRIPAYNIKFSPLGNLLYFIKLFLSGTLNPKNNQNISQTVINWLNVDFNLKSITDIDCLYELEEDIYIYDVDNVSNTFGSMMQNIMNNALNNLPKEIVYKSKEELIEITKNNKENTSLQLTSLIKRFETSTDSKNEMTLLQKKRG